MARYDEDPDFAGAFPGAGAFDAHNQGMTAAGSSSPGAQPGPYHEGGGEVIGSPARITRPYDSIIAGSTPLVQQTTLSTTSAINAQVDPVSHADQSQNVAAGHVAGPSHPNAGR